MAEPVQFENVDLRKIMDQLNVERTVVSEQDILSLLKDSFKNNELFAKEFNQRVIIPLTQKIERKIRVSDIVIDGKKFGESVIEDLTEKTIDSVDKMAENINDQLEKAPNIKIEFNTDKLSKDLSDSLQKETKSPIKQFGKDLLKSATGISFDKFFDQTPASTKKMSKQYQRVLEGFLTNLEKAVKTQPLNINTKNGFNIGQILGDTPAMGISTWRKWDQTKRVLLKKVSDSADKFKFEKDQKLNISNLLGDSPSMGITTWMKWNDTRKELLEKIQKYAKRSLKFEEGEQKLNISSILGDAPAINRDAKRKWNDTRVSLLDKIQKYTKKMKFEEGQKLDISGILGESPAAGIITRLKWSKTRRDLLNKISTAADEAELDFEKIDISKLLGVPEEESMGMKLQYLNFRRRMFKKIEKEFESSKIDSDINTKSLLGLTGVEVLKDKVKIGKEVAEKSEFTKVEEKDKKDDGKEKKKEDKKNFHKEAETDAPQEVSVVDISPKILKKLIKGFREDISDDTTKEKEQKEQSNFIKDLLGGKGGIGSILKKAVGFKTGPGMGRLGSVSTLAGSVPIVALAAATAYGIHKYGKQANEAQKKEGETLLNSAEQQKKGMKDIKEKIDELTKQHGEDFSKPWDDLLKSNRFKKVVQGKDPLQAQSIYFRELRRMEESLSGKKGDSLQKQEQPLIEQPNIQKQEQPSIEQPNFKKQEQPIQQPEEVDIDEFDKGPVMNDYIWRKDSKPRPFSADDNILAMKDDRGFDKIVTALDSKAVNQPVQAPQNFDGLQKEIRNLANTVVTAMNKNELRDIKPMPQQSQNLGGISSDAGEVRDPAYVLRNRVWERMNRIHTII